MLKKIENFMRRAKRFFAVTKREKVFATALIFLAIIFNVYSTFILLLAVTVIWVLG